MCQECGCGLPGPTRIDGRPADEISSPLVSAAAPHLHRHTHEHTHPHDHTHEGETPGLRHSHPHEHVHTHADDGTHPSGADHVHPATADHPALEAPVLSPGAHASRTVEVHQHILAANERMAERNRGYFQALGLLVLNVVSSPGSGKTTLLQKTIERLAGRARMGVIVGDLETDADAQRLRTTGAPVVQITTGTLCHLDADMVARALPGVKPKTLDILAIENVGNLVCPASFDLGEALRVVLWSVTEGEDKPLKYPPLFHSAHAILITKTDLAPAVEFRPEVLRANLRRVNPGAAVLEVSARAGAGLDAWCDYLLERRAALTAGA